MNEMPLAPVRVPGLTPKKLKVKI